MSLPVKKGDFQWLDFDIENRPLTYWREDRPTSEITAIGACWVGKPESLRVWLLRPAATDAEHDAMQRRMLDEFAAMYAVADGVTGHYIRRHDLGILQAHMVEYGLPLLGPKLAQDTKLDYFGGEDQPKTQEYLAELFELQEAKYHMTQRRWRRANRLTVEGLAQTERRVRDDVLQHMELRRRMLELGLLGPGKEWRG